MNIVISVSNIRCGGGISKYVYTLSEILSSLGHKVSVLVTHGDNNEIKQNACHFSGDISIYSSSSRFLLLRYWKTLVLLRQLKADLIINNYNAVVQYLLPFVARSVKIVHVLHNDTDDFYRIGNINNKQVAAWIAPTTAIAKRFKIYTQNHNNEKVHVIPHGVSACTYNGALDLTVPELTFVGVLYEHKGVLLLPEIIKKLLAKELKFRFNIVGDGELRGRLECGLLHEIKAGVVRFYGMVTPTKVYSILYNTSIFVYPTQLDAFGLVIAEAMMCGAVPVVSHLEGITDNLVDDGKSGFLAQVGDTDAFVEKIAYLLQNPVVMKNMQATTQEVAKQKFSLDAMRENYTSLINSL